MKPGINPILAPLDIQPTEHMLDMPILVLAQIPHMKSYFCNDLCCISKAMGMGIETWAWP